MIASKSLLATGLLSLILAISCYALYQKAEKAKADLVYEQAQRLAVSSALESSNKMILELNNRIKTSQRASQELTEANLKLEQDFNETKKKLESHIGRLEKAFQKKPKLMEKLVNRSFNKFIDQVSCNSGDLDACKD